MKSQKSKKAQRNELNELVKSYLDAGGEVKSVPSGISGNTDNSNLFKNAGNFEPKTERTPVTEEVKALEERKSKKQLDSSTKKTGLKRARKKMIVDDFGDPIRWVWEED